MYPNPADEMGLGAMVCPKCRVQEHEECPGGTWCDCGHRVPEPIEAEAEELQP